MFVRTILCLIVALFLASCSGVQPKAEAPPTVAEQDFESYYYYILGYESFISGQWEDARNYYKKALEHDPGSNFMRSQLAHLLYREGSISEAETMAEAVLRDDPVNVDALRVISEIYVGTKRRPEAIRALKRALELSPDDQDTAMALGRMYHEMGMTSSAAEIFTRILEDDPDQYFAMDYLATIHIDMKQYEKAEGYLRGILEIKQIDSVYMRLGIIYELLGRLKESAESYESALRINPQNTQAMERLAQVFIKQRLNEKALEQYLAISRRQPENMDIRVKLGLLYYEEKELDKAIEEFRFALSVKPDNTSIRYYLAVALEEAEKYGEAIEEFRRIITAEPKNINAFLHLGIIYSKQKKEDEAVKIFEEILEFDKERPEIYQFLGAAYMRRHDYKKAEEILGEALVRFDKNDELHFQMAMVYDKTERSEDMIRELRRSIDINPVNAEALNYLGYYFADKNMNLDEAHSLIGRALEIKPENGYFLDSMGWVLFRRGDIGDALEKLKRAAELTGEDPVIFEHMGDVYHALHDYEKAVESWEKSLLFEGKEEGLKDRVEKKIRELKSSP